jgi:type IV pilus assembly protein PilB
MRPSQRKVRIGDALVEDGLITAEQLAQVLQEQKETGRLLGEMLVEKELVTGQAIIVALSKRMGIRGCQLRRGLFDAQLLELIGREEAKRLKVLPMFKIRDMLTVAMVEPQSLPSIDRLRHMTGCNIRPILALENEIIAAIDAGADSAPAEGFLSAGEGEKVEYVESEPEEEAGLGNLEIADASSPVVNLVNRVLLRAIKDASSDVHIEPDVKATRIRYRVHGVLRDLMRPPAGMHSAIVSRVKICGRMDIAERRLPQEGRVRLQAEGREIDLRISSMPTVLGEKIVIRILDKQRLSVKLENLGFRPRPLESFLSILHRPYGLVLVTGPTGSGKTTTLYSALSVLRSPERNIMTVEDPVEYQLDLINQIQVQESIGMTFARALRSILRQDPDVIMVGEIRDELTARVAVQAALTGHLVLATLHTNDAAGSVARLVDMGIEPYLLSGALNGVVAQRLVRTVCPNCLETYQPAPPLLRAAKLTDGAPVTFNRGAGCTHCYDSGFAGRAGIYEVMEIGPELRRMMRSDVSTQDLREAWIKLGGTTLRQEAVLAAVEGRTSLEEALSVTHSEDESSSASAARGPAHEPAADTQ